MEYVAAIKRIRSNCSTLFRDTLDVCLLKIVKNKAIRKYSETLSAITHLSATKTGYFMVRIFQNYLAASFLYRTASHCICLPVICSTGYLTDIALRGRAMQYFISIFRSGGNLKFSEINYEPLQQISFTR